MNGKRAKEIKRNTMEAMYSTENIATRKDDILNDRQFKKVFRKAKKNYTRKVFSKTIKE